MKIEAVDDAIYSSFYFVPGEGKRERCKSHTHSLPKCEVFATRRKCRQKLLWRSTSEKECKVKEEDDKWDARCGMRMQSEEGEVRRSNGTIATLFVQVSDKWHWKRVQIEIRLFGTLWLHVSEGRWKSGELSSPLCVSSSCRIRTFLSPCPCLH